MRDEWSTNARIDGCAAGSDMFASGALLLVAVGITGMRG